MAGRRTNLALAALSLAALLTGLLSFAIGTAEVAWVAGAHGVVGLAMVLLVPWKTRVANRGLSRPQAGKWVSLTSAVMITVALVSGVLFSTGLVLDYGILNAMQVHVGSALIGIVLTGVHFVQRPIRPRAPDLDRRNLVRSAALGGAAMVAWLGLEGSMRIFGLPGDQRRETGSHERASFNPAALPVVSWINDSVPRLDDWQLAIRDGEREEIVTIADLATFSDEVTATLDCTSGWYSTQEWTGVRLDRLLDGFSGESLLVTSATGYRRRFPITDSPALLLATGLGGQPLTAGHGAPARIVAPGRRGFWWVKWVVEIELDDRPWWWQSPFPLT